MFWMICRKLRNWHRDEPGMALVESLIAVAILGTTVVTFVTSLATGSLAIRETGQEVVAQSLARSQLEYIKDLAYDAEATSYPAVAAPPGYAISVNVTSIPGTNANIQKVTASISHDGELITTIEDYKVNR
jgi:type II secretory pathway pseudopilin PulG